MKLPYYEGDAQCDGEKSRTRRSPTLCNRTCPSESELGAGNGNRIGRYEDARIRMWMPAATSTAEKDGPGSDGNGTGIDGCAVLGRKFAEFPSPRS